jgi:hypothetical protein
VSDAFAAQRAADAHSRRIAQTDFARPFAIEAGAGTGKTAILVARVLAWCLGPGWERARAAEPDADPARIAERVLRGVVAITFTEAAAAEMDARIEQALALLEHGERPVGFEMPAPLDRVHALRTALDQLVVETIHAYCRRLLAAHPIEAGLHPRFEIDADGAAAAVAVRDAITEQLGAGYERGDQALLELARRGIGPLELEEELIAHRGSGATAAELARDPLAPARIEALRARLLDAHEALDRAAAGRLAAAGVRAKSARAVAQALPIALAALAAPARDGEDLGRLRADLLAAWDKSARSKLANWGKGAFAIAERDALAERPSELAAPAKRLAELLQHLEDVDRKPASRSPVVASLARDAEERLRRRGRQLRDLLGAPRRQPAPARGRGYATITSCSSRVQDTDAPVRDHPAIALLGDPAEPGLFLVGDPPVDLRLAQRRPRGLRGVARARARGGRQRRHAVREPPLGARDPARGRARDRARDGARAGSPARVRGARAEHRARDGRGIRRGRTRARRVLAARALRRARRSARDARLRSGRARGARARARPVRAARRARRGVAQLRRAVPQPRRLTSTSAPAEADPVLRSKNCTYYRCRGITTLRWPCAARPERRRADRAAARARRAFPMRRGCRSGGAVPRLVVRRSAGTTARARRSKRSCATSRRRSTAAFRDRARAAGRSPRAPSRRRPPRKASRDPPTCSSSGCARRSASRRAARFLGAWRAVSALGDLTAALAAGEPVGALLRRSAVPWPRRSAERRAHAPGALDAVTVATLQARRVSTGTTCT